MIEPSRGLYKYELRVIFESLVKRSEIEITALGRRSGKPPVWFMQDQNKIYLLSVEGSKSQWFENIQARARMSLISGDKKIDVEAKPQTDEVDKSYI